VTPPTAQPAAPCGFPPAADANKIDGAAVVIRVLVRTSGQAELVQTLEEPGFGFGEEATRCAMSWRYAPATDTRGEPVRAWTPPFRVRFVR
jgi:protein TonB